MRGEPILEIRIGRKSLLALAVAVTMLAAVLVLPDRAGAQKPQENFKDKFKVASETGGIAVAVSADGKYVYVAGPGGILVSDDFGKTGSWVQTAQIK